MMPGKKKVRFIRPWQGYQVGDEIYPPGTLRDWLREHGYIEIVQRGRPKTISRAQTR